MTINNRFKTIIDKQFKGNKRAFANAVGISPTVVENVVGTRSGKPSYEVIQKVCANANISAEWLISGEGEMLKTKRIFSESPARPENNEATYFRKDTNFYPVSQVAEPDSYVTKPRIPFDAAAGALSIVTNSVTEVECEHLPVIPIFPAYDFTIFVRGDSMLPDIKSGDELACRFVREAAAIKWGETYVLDTADGVVVKNLHRGPGTSIICRSLNPRFEDYSVDRSEINRIARVVGLVRHL